MTDGRDFKVSLWGGPVRPRCFLEVYLEQAGHRPDSVAIVDGAEETTYGELTLWTAAVARALDVAEVGPGDRVAVSGPRSAAVIAAMLGASFHGATYLPMDATYPTRRLEYMLRDSGATTLLYWGREPSLSSAVMAIPIPRLDRYRTGSWPDGNQSAEVELDGLDLRCRPDRPYYMIYSSGSTGWPKGVVIPHSCLDNMVEWQVHASYRRDVRTAQYAPLNFDVWFQEVLGSLAGGGTIIIMPEPLRRDPAMLLQWLVEERIERLFIPYMGLQMLAVAASVRSTFEEAALREVNTAGEQVVCTPQIRQFFKRLGKARLANHYGQSESAMVTSHLLADDPDQWESRPPIGQPLPGCELLIDPLDPVNPAVGELVVAGLPVSLGYWRHDSLNTERYVEVKETAHRHTRGFRTGDLVQVRDGTVYFLGRLNDETKIRGVRVDPLEVDAQLTAFTGVESAACVVLEGPTRTLRAAIKASNPQSPPSQFDLLEHLKGTLPEQSVPLSITTLSEFPRDASGKVDKRAIARLIATELGLPESYSEFSAV